MKIIGITGSIASGKSELSKYISSKGYSIIDADYISRNITKKDKVGYKEIVKEFSKDILNSDNEINRQKLSQIVFKDKAKLRKLNSLLHPIIFDEIDRQIDKCKEENIIFLDAPLLFETKLYKKCDEIILIYCSENIQIKRIIQRDNIDEQGARLIIKNQMNVKTKKQKSTYIIENNSSLEDLYFKIDNILKIINMKD